MLWLLAESALRSSVLALIVWFGLKVLRVRNPQMELTAWTVVLSAAIAMPLLMRVATVTVPTRLPVQPSVMEILSTPPTAPADASSLPASLPALVPSPSPVGFAGDWQALATGLYLLVAGVLALRLSIGVAMIWRLSRSAEPIRERWADGSDIRTCSVGMPVTFGRIILFPPHYARWSWIKQRAVLAHECSHVARGDYWVLLLAALHRALFWFNPLSWWLLNRLAVLMEAASDDAAIADLHDRTSYAEILLDLAKDAGGSPLGVAMARPATVARRVERILREKNHPTKLGRRSRLLMAASLLPVTAVAAGAVAQNGSVEQRSAADDLKIVSVGEVATVSLPPLPVNRLAVPRDQSDAAPAAFRAPEVLRSIPVTPVRALPVSLAGVPSASDGEQPRPIAVTRPINMTGSWNFRYPVGLRSPSGRPAGGVPICQFIQTGDRLTGTCKILWVGAGPVTGKVDGRHVEFQWNFSFCPEIITPEYSSRFAVTRFRGDFDERNVLHGGYQSWMQVGWTRTFFAAATASPDEDVPCYFPHYGWPTFAPAPKDEDPWRTQP
jgi:beta-lactamase regulating signal transducer with metallopeptidase domain